MEQQKNLEQLYNSLLKVITRQRRALGKEDLKKLDLLTKEKEGYIRELADLEETINVLERDSRGGHLRELRNKVVEADRLFIKELRDQEKAFREKMKDIEETRENLGNIGSVYGKKFTTPRSSFDKQC